MPPCISLSKVEQKRKGPRKKYGQKINYRNIPEKYLVERSIEGDLKPASIKLRCCIEEFAQPLNVVIITKTNLKTGAFANVNLFSSDLELSYRKDHRLLQFADSKSSSISGTPNSIGVWKIS